MLKKPLAVINRNAYTYPWLGIVHFDPAFEMLKTGKIVAAKLKPPANLTRIWLGTNGLAQHVAQG